MSIFSTKVILPQEDKMNFVGLLQFTCAQLKKAHSDIDWLIVTFLPLLFLGGKADQ